MSQPAALRRLVCLAAIAFAFCAGAATAGVRTTPVHFSGENGPGSFYEIDVPTLWNGDLVLYAHGIVEASRPVVPPTNQGGRAACHISR